MSLGNYRDVEAFYENIYGPQANRRGIGSVETGMHVLETLVALEEPSSLKTIAQNAGLDTSQAHRYLSSLVNSGVIRQNSASGLYDLGPKALKMGLAALSRLDPVSIISETIEELASHCNHTALLSIWGPNGPVVVRWYSGNPPVYTTLAVGSLLSVTRSATGRIFMSFLGDEYLAPLIEAEGWKIPLEENKELVDIRSEIQKTCLATVDGTLIPGLRAFSMPVFGAQNSLPGAITLIGSETIPQSDDKTMQKNLDYVCKRLTSELGGEWPS